MWNRLRAFKKKQMEREGFDGGIQRGWVECISLVIEVRNLQCNKMSSVRYTNSANLVSKTIVKDLCGE